MAKTLLAQDRVTLLLALVPYLRDHGPTPVAELADAFSVSPGTLRRLVRFLGTAGVPGETLSYQHEDLFDIDWNALERDDVVSLTHIVAVDGTPRFAPAETAALIAGLQALTAVLPPADAELAGSLAAKLGEAFGAPDAASTITVTAQPEGPELPAIVAAIDAGRALAFQYRDVSGNVTERTVDPIGLRQEGGSWYLRAHCRDRGAERTFRADQISGVRDAGEAERLGEAAAPAAAEPVFDIVATIPRLRLGSIEGFAPQILGEDADGRVRVRVEAWHGGSAIRLVQESGGTAIVESPDAARAAVRAWAQRALAAYDA